MAESERLSSFTLRQAGQRNSILASVQYVHDSPTGQRTVISTCAAGCLACLVEQTIRQAEFPQATASEVPSDGPLS